MKDSFRTTIETLVSYADMHKAEIAEAGKVLKTGTPEEICEASWLLSISMTLYIAQQIYKMGRVEDGSIDPEDILEKVILRLAIKAKEYDYQSGNQFSTFAKYQIMNILQSVKNEPQSGIKISKRRKENVASLKKAFIELSKELDDVPTLEELSSYMNMSVAQVSAIDADRCQMYAASLENNSMETDADGLTLLDKVSSDSSAVENSEREVFQNSVRNLIKTLPEKERKAFLLLNGVNEDFSFIEGKVTQESVARVMGVSANTVKRLYDKARSHLAAEAQKNFMTADLMSDEFAA